MGRRMRIPDLHWDRAQPRTAPSADPLNQRERSRTVSSCSASRDSCWSTQSTAVALVQTGRRTQNRQPPSGVASTPTFPPCASTSLLTVASPRPKPDSVVLPRTCGWKTLSRRSGTSPGPVSLTSRRTSFSTSRAEIVTRRTGASPVNFIAFETRLVAMLMSTPGPHATTRARADSPATAERPSRLRALEPRDTARTSRTLAFRSPHSPGTMWPPAVAKNEQVIDELFYVHHRAGHSCK